VTLDRAIATHCPLQSLHSGDPELAGVDVRVLENLEGLPNTL
jgi:hypothetical protein